MDKLLLKTAEAAEAIGVSRRTVCSLLASGGLPSVTIGGSIRVPLDRLRQWIDTKIVERAPSDDSLSNVSPERERGDGTGSV